MKLKVEKLKSGYKLILDINGVEFKTNALKEDNAREVARQLSIYNNNLIGAASQTSFAYLDDNSGWFKRMLFKYLKKFIVVRTYKPDAHTFYRLDKTIYPYIAGADEFYSSLVYEGIGKEVKEQIKDLTSNESK